MRLNTPINKAARYLRAYTDRTFTPGDVWAATHVKGCLEAAMDYIAAVDALDVVDSKDDQALADLMERIQTTEENFARLFGSVSVDGEVMA